MPACLYVAVWGFTQAKERLLEYFDAQAAPLVEKDDLDFAHVTIDDRQFLLFNLPMRATPRNTAVSYILKIAHAHIMVEPGVDVDKVVKTCVERLSPIGRVYSWHRDDVDAAEICYIDEPHSPESARQMLIRLSTDTDIRLASLPQQSTPSAAAVSLQGATPCERISNLSMLSANAIKRAEKKCKQ
ncbi:hypothetical protein GMRT_12220 [Giardia muris]|uniref:Uncharacterized protein n=1 Tax=Giardia muris TaxID=5742 RepID=A0A4Z1SY62_GIAMU|nr:hypothetical protein GMRT_12220 [Giardia muris]|eukprot:TNJ30626.1 hypothetical protein GMRT_12220 [Giardia muris]